METTALSPPATAPAADDRTLPGPPSETPPIPTRRKYSFTASGPVVVVIGVLVTALLAIAARGVHDANERRLLRQRVREAAAVASASFPSVQIPLSSAAVLAEATNADPTAFRRLTEPVVAAGRPFTSMSLWSTDAATPRPIVVVGIAPELASEPSATVAAYLHHATGATTMSLHDILNSPDRRLGYALTVPSKDARYVVYGEAQLPAGRRARIDSNSAFADFDYALFVGSKADPTQLLASSTGGASLHGRMTSATVPFGDTQLLVVMSPRGELGGTLLARLWWVLILLGLVLTVAAAALVERLTRTRSRAETLALENARLYAWQRSVAQALQRSMLSDDFPAVAGMEVGARYVAGVEGIEIGGDWYDVIDLGDERVMIAVGDVSGRGLPAATMMASLRFAIRAYAAQGDDPSAVLAKLSGLALLSRDGHFATALCAELDLRARTLKVANAGHPEPLLVDRHSAEFVPTAIGIPVGVHRDPTYRDTTVTLPSAGTLLFYTDGLIERRGEMLDTGLDRLADAARDVTGSLETLLSTVLDHAIPDGSADDTALLGVRWTR